MGTRLAELKPIGEPAMLALSELTPTPGNRAMPKDDDLKGLASSIRNVGLLYPIIVKPDAERDGQYRIVAGERRWRAMKMLKLESAPCVILNDTEDEARAEVLRVVENHQRRNLEPLEEAAAVQGLLDLGLEPEAVARSLGRSRAWVARRASLTELTEVWLAAVHDPETAISTWPPSHLEAISRFPAETQARILERHSNQWKWNVPTLRDLVEVTGQYLRILSAAPWRLDDETLCPEAGSCEACWKRSSRVPDLFEGELEPENSPPGDRCLDSTCWKQKADVFLTRRAEETRKNYPEMVLLANDDEGVLEELEETFQTEVLAPAEVATSRKSDPRAVPALVVSGPGLGRIKWVQPVNEPHLPRHAENGSVSNGERTYTPPEKTIDQKRQAYDKRRRQVVIESVRERLMALAKADLATVTEVEGGATLANKGLALRTLVLLSSLLSQRGWQNDIHYGRVEFPAALPWDSLDSFKNHELGTGSTREAALDLCWGLMRLALNVLASLLVVGPGASGNEQHHVEAEVVASMLGFDIATLRAEAAEKVPYAKLWRDQVTDDWADPSRSNGTAESGVAEANGSESR